MKPARLLDGERLALLQRRLGALLASAPAHGLLSITLDLGSTSDDWLGNEVAQAQATYWARPALGEHRLALGRAMTFNTTGTARFAALQAAFTGLVPVWLHDDSDRTGTLPAAHIGFAFADEGPGDWPNARLVVPAVLLQSQAGRCTATFSCAVCDGETALDNWRQALQPVPAAHHVPTRPSELLRRSSLLADRAFVARAHAALAGIAAGQLEKVVLTRSVLFDAAQSIAIAPLLAALHDAHPECAIYGTAQHGQYLLGATPERLVALKNGMVRADALAGTAWPSNASPSDQPGSLDLHDDKNSREQQLVVDAVRAALTPLCISMAPPEAPEIMQLRGLQHLRSGIAGQVRHGVGLFDLIAALHPTPAVGGTPRTAASHWLQAHGEQRGAWYTGGVGWIDRAGDGEVAVALRCARIIGTQAELFAGAGIVAGSSPLQELAETEAKLGTMIDALRHALPLGRPAGAAASRTGTE